MLEALMYVSAADPRITRSDIDAILETAVRNNLRDKLTGALIFSGSIFVQILEGETLNIQNLMTKIRADRRHDAVTVVAQEVIGHRRFGSWSMAYRATDGLATEQLHAQFGWDNAISKLVRRLPSERSLSALSDDIANILDHDRPQCASSQF